MTAGTTQLTKDTQSPDETNNIRNLILYQTDAGQLMATLAGNEEMNFIVESYL
jgi:hypothetical protein